MGGVLSAWAVAFSPSEGKSLEDISRAMMHCSICGGITLAVVNILSAESCAQRADQLVVENSSIVGDNTTILAGAQCLKVYCTMENHGWAVVSLCTAVLGAASSCFRSRVLCVSFLLVFAGRGISCLLAMLMALSDSQSCSAWSLRTTYWIPPVTAACVFAYGSLAWKFSRVLGQSYRMRNAAVLEVDLAELDLDLDEEGGGTGKGAASSSSPGAKPNATPRKAPGHTRIGSGLVNFALASARGLRTGGVVSRRTQIVSLPTLMPRAQNYAVIEDAMEPCATHAAQTHHGNNFINHDV